MKANEAPDKIYLQVCGDCPQTDCVTCKFEDLEDVTWNKDRIFPKDVEYTRTDAFIEKAADYIKKDMLDNLAFQGRLNRIEIIDGIIEMFIKAMKGEQIV